MRTMTPFMASSSLNLTISSMVSMDWEITPSISMTPILLPKPVDMIPMKKAPAKTSTTMTNRTKSVFLIFDMSSPLTYMPIGLFQETPFLEYHPAEGSSLQQTRDLQLG